ncbi:MAG: hypothetical protein ACI865_001724 [Flavobacteriaceae bacterium]|jgi:hypothetical protein
MIEVSKIICDKYYYNEQGLRVFFQSYDEQYKLVGSATSSYSGNGSKTQEETIVMGMTLSNTYVYNEVGQLLNAYRTSIMVDASWSHEYNEFGPETRYLNISSSFEMETNSSYTYY